jgi:translation initiation factor 4A
MDSSNTLETSSDVKTFKTFDEMGLSDNLLRGIYSYGFEVPSKIQQLAIIPIKERKDILAQAQSGTGKTGAFTIGSMSVMDPAIQKPQVMVLVPTQELAKQIFSVAKQLGVHIPISCYCATGGSPIRDDIKAIENGAQFIVGTPGRIFDLMNRKVLYTDNIRCLIMDEADQMLEDRFYKQVMCILEIGFPKTTKVSLFSATMPQEVIDVANKLLQEPVRILIQPEDVTLEGIKQFSVTLEKEEWKYDVLCDIYKQLNINQAIIYCNKRQRAEWLAEKLSADGYPLSCIHGEMENDERRRRMEEFRSGKIRVLISTDLLARGIDVQQVSLVMNFELPPNRENYIHRIGRSGRYGRKGVAINLISPNEVKLRNEIETHYGTKMVDLPEDLNLIELV